MFKVSLYITNNKNTRFNEVDAWVIVSENTRQNICDTLFNDRPVTLQTYSLITTLLLYLTDRSLFTHYIAFFKEWKSTDTIQYADVFEIYGRQRVAKIIIQVIIFSFVRQQMA